MTAAESQSAGTATPRFTPEPITNVSWTGQGAYHRAEDKKCSGIALPPCTSLHLTCGPGTAGATTAVTDLLPGLPQLGNVAVSCLRGVVVTD